VAFTLAVAGGFENPAGAALLPALVPREIFQNAVVLSSAARNLAVVTGPALAGFAIDAGGPRAAYALSTALFALSLAALLGVRRAKPRAEQARVSLAQLPQFDANLRKVRGCRRRKCPELRWGSPQIAV
jgi:MFS family permease